MQLRILQHEVALSHCAFYFGDGVTHHAAKPRLCLGTVDDLLDGYIHHAAIEHRRIVAATAPLRRTRAHHLLHVLNALAVPLIVEGGEVVRGGVPLHVDVLVATLTRLRLHEELAGNQFAIDRLRRTWKERPIRSIALALHALRWGCGVLNVLTSFPSPFAVLVCRPREC